MYLSSGSGEPEEEEDESESGAQITEWEYRVWLFRRGVEIILFDDYDEDEDEEIFASIRRNPPHEYDLYARGYFDGYRRLDMPYLWGIALDIIKQIEAKRADNEIINASARQQSGN